LFSSFLGGKISAGDSVTTLDTEIEEIRTPLTKIAIDDLVVITLGMMYLPALGYCKFIVTTSADPSICFRLVPTVDSATTLRARLSTLP
jgi:hypothetical protein